MFTNDAIADHKSDSVNLYLDFISLSLSASSIRLLRGDLNKFADWRGANKQLTSGRDIESIVDIYKKCCLNSDKPTTVARKVSSVQRFLHWDADQSSTVATSVVEPTLPTTNVSDSDSFQQKHSLPLLFTFVGLLFVGIAAFAWLLFTSIKGEQPWAKRFAIYIPVISRTLPSGLNHLSLDIYTYASAESNDFLDKHVCKGKLMSFETKSYVMIDSVRDCNVTYHNPMLADLRQGALYADVLINSQILNAKRIVLSTNQPEIGNFGLSGGQKSFDLYLSRPYSAVTNDPLALADPISTLEAQIASEPRGDVSLPLGAFSSNSVSDGDIVTLSGNVLTQALLDSPVMGVVAGEMIVLNGKVGVNVSQDSLPVSAGDYVSAGLIAGTVVRASLGYENIVGVALEEWSGDSDKVKILLLRTNF